MMEESQLEAQKREEMLRMYHACKEALRIIGEVNMSTVTTDLPPSVSTDWLRLAQLFPSCLSFLLFHFSLEEDLAERCLKSVMKLSIFLERIN